MKNYFLKSNLLLFGLVLHIGIINAADATVSSISALNSAISSASAGNTITLTNGTYSGTITIGKSGTSTNPITIKAQTIGGVILNGASYIKITGDYIVVNGFKFSGTSSSLPVAGEIINVAGGSNRITNVTFDNYNSTNADDGGSGLRYIELSGTNHEVDHCAFLYKKNVGSCVFSNRKYTSDKGYKIHHNVFAYRTPENGTYDSQNDQDAIRLGSSSSSLSDANCEVYDNLFHDWVGEIEIISNKSCSNKYYNNTFNNYAGAMTLRHGNNCQVYNNFFFANTSYKTGGIRVIGESHKIYNNYIANTRHNGSDNTGGINISNGFASPDLSEYYQVKNCSIYNNTFVNNDKHIRIGTEVKTECTEEPVNLSIVNNVFYSSSSSYVTIEQTTPASGTNVYKNNIKQSGTSFVSSFTSGNVNTSVSSGLLSSSTTDGYLRIISSSGAVNSGLSGYATTDITGATRTDGTTDRGCEEYIATGGGTAIPYTIADLGTKLGPITATTPTDLPIVDKLALDNRGVKVYPNPVVDELIVSIDSNKKFTSLIICDMLGRIQHQEKMLLKENSEFGVDVKRLPAGVYIVQLQGNAVNEQVRFLKK